MTLPCCWLSCFVCDVDAAANVPGPVPVRAKCYAKGRRPTISRKAAARHWMVRPSDWNTSDPSAGGPPGRQRRVIPVANKTPRRCGDTEHRNSAGTTVRDIMSAYVVGMTLGKRAESCRPMRSTMCVGGGAVPAGLCVGLEHRQAGVSGRLGSWGSCGWHCRVPGYQPACFAVAMGHTPASRAGTGSRFNPRTCGLGGSANS